MLQDVDEDKFVNLWSSVNLSRGENWFVINTDSRSSAT